MNTIFNKKSALIVGCVALVALITFVSILIWNQSNEITAEEGHAYSGCKEYVFFDSLEDLINKADLVVMGKIIGLEVQEFQLLKDPIDETEEFWLPYIVYQLEVSQDLNGKLQVGEILEFRALLDPDALAIPDKINKRNNEGIFFLSTNEENDLPPSLMNLSQGYIGVNVKDHKVNYNYFADVDGIEKTRKPKAEKQGLDQLIRVIETQLLLKGDAES